MNYTKGEWRVKEVPQNALESEGVGFLRYVDEYHITVEDGITCIAVMGTTWARGDAEGNAHLIAAAPEMYEALKAFDDYLCAAPPHNMKLKAHATKLMEQSLAKAEGKEAK